MAPSLDDQSSLYNFVVREGYGVKGLVDSGLSDVPVNYIQPPQERIDKKNATRHELAAIDMSKLNGPQHDQVVADIASAAETLGFFQVVNHGVRLELLESLKDSAHKFFSLSPEKKAEYCKGVSPSPLVTYGTSFNPEKEKALEWKDHISMAYTNDDDAQNYWPNECKEVALEYLKSSMKVSKIIIEILMENLGARLDDSSIEELLDLPMVKMNYYPACPAPDLTVGVGRHSDMGTLTVLLQDGIGGLYVRREDDLDKNINGEWLEIPPIPGALVINVGDAIQILSNGRYKSAEHRVRTTSTQSRVSIPYFTHPKRTVKIGPLPEAVEKDGVAHYRQVLFGDYMKHFLGHAHEGKKPLDFVRLGSASQDNYKNNAEMKICV